MKIININNQENIMKNREKKNLNEENNNILIHLKINISLMEMKIKVIQC